MVTCLWLSPCLGGGRGAGEGGERERIMEKENSSDTIKQIKVYRSIQSIKTTPALADTDTLAQKKTGHFLAPLLASPLTWVSFICSGQFHMLHMDNFVSHLTNKIKMIGIQRSKIHDHKAYNNISHQSKYIQKKMLYASIIHMSHV